jgi:hypothetical protein
MPGVKGKTNNPNGRPLGALNALARDNYVSVSELVGDNIETVKEELAKLKETNATQYLRLCVDLIKLITPSAPPIIPDEEESGSDLEERVIEASKGVNG